MPQFGAFLKTLILTSDLIVGCGRAPARMELVINPPLHPHLPGHLLCRFHVSAGEGMFAPGAEAVAACASQEKGFLSMQSLFRA